MELTVNYFNGRSYQRHYRIRQKDVIVSQEDPDPDLCFHKTITIGEFLNSEMIRDALYYPRETSSWISGDYFLIKRIKEILLYPV